MPHELGIGLDRQLALELERIDRLHPGERDLNQRKGGQQHKKGRHPAGIQPREQLVHKHAGEHRIDDANQCSNQRNQRREDQGVLRAGQPLAHKTQHALGLAVGHETLRRLQQDADPGERLVELLHRHLHQPPRRVVQHGAIAPEAVQHDEVVEVPVDDAGKPPVLLQALGLHAISLCTHAVAACRKQQVLRVGAVPGYAAVHAKLLQRNPFVVIRHHHRQGGRAALQRFQLEDDRHLRHLAGGCWHFVLLTHSAFAFLTRSETIPAQSAR